MTGLRRMTKGEQIEQFLADGASVELAAAKFGVTRQYAYLINLYGGYQAYLAKGRHYATKRARELGVPETCVNGGMQRYAYTHNDVLKAIDDGMSYGDVAKKFRITRGVVAGVVDRYRRKAA